ncbi:MAG: glutamate synthase-related protein, partial [bacterium]
AMFQEELDREFVEYLRNPVPLIAPPERIKKPGAKPVRMPEAEAIPTPHIQPAPLQQMYHRPMSNAVVLRTNECINCGICVKLCPFGVHVRPEGYKRVLTPLSDLCIGEACKEKDFYCINKCPVDALGMEQSPHKDTLGDMRWTSDLILATWHMAETATAPEQFEYKTGKSGGGFDRLQFVFESAQEKPKAPPAPPTSESVRRLATEISTALELNRRDEGPQIIIPIPIYGGGMSFGSVGITTMLSRAKAAKEWGTFFSTGEGGYPDEIKVYDDHVITQVATGLFGVKEDTIQRVRIIELKYAQGAKPGLGGHLLADKNTAVVAAQREAVPGTSLFSPFPFHSVYSVEDPKKPVAWILATNPDALISVKVSTPTDVDMVAIGSYYAGAHILQLDGGYGGTGAAPEIAKKNIAMPIEYAIPKVHRYLMAEGVRDKIVIMASGGIRTAYDIAKAIALGADGVVVGTSELVAIGCVRCGNCESGRGCPKGITTTDAGLYPLIQEDWGGQRIINLYAAWHQQLCEILKNLGMKDIRELVGRTDALGYIPPSWN